MLKKDGETTYIDEFISPLNTIDFKDPIVGSIIMVKLTKNL